MQLDSCIDRLPQSNKQRKDRNATPRIRYIGSKARVAEALLNIIGYPKNGRHRFVDLFCGGGAVSRAAALAGWSTHANDHLLSSVMLTSAQLLSRHSLDFSRLGGYDAVIEKLNSSPIKYGPIYREYSPSGFSRSGHMRKYFSTTNAAKIDGVREMIEAMYLSRQIGKVEQSLLIADLIAAANSVANIAGTYGCFLSRWTMPALSEIRLFPRKLPEHLPAMSHSADDAFRFKDQKSDVLYCDPPYTKRQYAAYYHLVETIALGDSPDVCGVAGIRAWEHKASPFCYKRRALKAFSELLTTKVAKRIYVSYSSQGHVPLEELSSTLANFGSIRVHEVKQIRRYTPNEVSRSRPSTVMEYLIEVLR